MIPTVQPKFSWRVNETFIQLLFQENGPIMEQVEQEKSRSSNPFCLTQAPVTLSTIFHKLTIIQSKKAMLILASSPPIIKRGSLPK